MSTFLNENGRSRFYLSVLRYRFIPRIVGRVLWILPLVAAVLVLSAVFKYFASPLIGRLIVACMEAAGGMWIKLAQALSYRGDVLSSQFLNLFERFQNNARPSAMSWRRAYLSGVQKRHSEILSRIEATVVGCGCIAQVHLAWGVDGRKYALKVIKPAEARRVRADIGILLGAARIFDLIPQWRCFSIKVAALEIAKLLEGQLELDVEAKNANIARERLAHMKGIVVPTPFVALCSPTHAVFEFIDDLTHILRFSPSAANESVRVAERCIRAIFTLIFQHGFVHADLQPGNLGMTRDGRLVILDFGLVSNLDEKTTRLFRDFFMGFVSGNGRLCARILLETARLVPKSLVEREFEERVRSLVRHYRYTTAADFQCVRFVAELFGLQRAFGIVAGADFSTAITAVVMLEGIIKRLAPGLDFQKELRVLLPAIIGRMAPRRPWDISTRPWGFRLVELAEAPTIGVRAANRDVVK